MMELTGVFVWIWDLLFGGLKSPFDERDRILLVTAHPDDESMFFCPTILNIPNRSQLFLLCLSTGNADGLGSTRQKELLDACKYLEVPLENVTIIDNPKLPDGMHTKWDEDVIVEYVDKEIKAQKITKVVTFDGYGISGHANHRATYRGTMKLMSEMCGQDGSPDLWVLESVNILRKFLGIFDLAVSCLFASSGTLSVVVCPNPFKSWHAMKLHKSQWLWFRKLFVIFSRYAFVNTLVRPLKTSTNEPH